MRTPWSRPARSSLRVLALGFVAAVAALTFDDRVSAPQLAQARTVEAPLVGEGRAPLPWAPSWVPGADQEASRAAGEAFVSAVPADDREADEAAALAAEVVAVVHAQAPPRIFRLQELGTTRRVDLVPFDAEGDVRAPDLNEIETWFEPVAMRIAKEPAHPIDPRLVELLMRISEHLEGAPIVLVSGHRKAGRGTSHRSYHVRGMAADIAVAGMAPRDLRKVALRLGAPGVGLYGGFVHVDVRDVPYRWGGGGGRSRGRPR